MVHLPWRRHELAVLSIRGIREDVTVRALNGERGHATSRGHYGAARPHARELRAMKVDYVLVVRADVPEHLRRVVVEHCGVIASFLRVPEQRVYAQGIPRVVIWTAEDGGPHALKLRSRKLLVRRNGELLLVSGRVVVRNAQGVVREARRKLSGATVPSVACVHAPTNHGSHGPDR